MYLTLTKLKGNAPLKIKLLLEISQALYLVSNDLQLDGYLGTSITKGQDLLVGLGLSYRIKKN